MPVCIMDGRQRPLIFISGIKGRKNLSANLKSFFEKLEFKITFAILNQETVHRGVVERFIAPVLKTGEPLRVPGVRIPPPLRNTSFPNSKSLNFNRFRLFVFAEAFRILI